MAQMLRVRALLVAAVLAAAALTAAGATAGGKHGHVGNGRKGDANAFTVTNLVSDQPGMAVQTDPNLVNAWGLAASAATPWWVADNGTNVSTLYDASGNPFPVGSPLVVSVPDAPTGAVAYTGGAFTVGTAAGAGSSKFLFSTEEGKILGWHPGLTAAIVGVDASAGGAIFKGLAVIGDTLYATDFHNGRVDVYDGSFNPVAMPAFAFTDPSIPAGFAPFGIQAINGNLFVTFAKQDNDAKDDVHGRGLGYVDEFDPTSGMLISRVAAGGPLNAPWGLAWAPSGFGRFGGDLLVGNFGNGKIHAYTPGSGNTWSRDGHLRNADGSPVKIDGLWALQFGMGGPNNGPASTLFFTAGPDDESHGLFGTITSA